MSFTEILGHDKEIEILKGAIAGERVAHAFLFTGPPGVGKRRVAVAFAAALNCPSPGPSNDACGECADCTRVEAGTHPNILSLEPDAGIIKIDRVREIQGALKYKVEHGNKVVIVDDADKFMPQAANAFLKTLEEPPPASVIILVSSRPSELLPTVVSRCRRVNFRPLSTSLVSEFLKREAGVDAPQAETAARMSNGSISRAMDLVEEGSLEGRAELVGRLRRLGPGDADMALTLAGELSKRDDLEEVLEFLKSWIRDMCVAKVGAGQLVVNIDLDRGPGAAWDTLPAWDAFSLIEDARRDTTPPRYMNKQLAMETMLLKLTGCSPLR